MHEEWPDDALHAGLTEHNPRALEALIHRYSREMSYFIRLVLDNTGTQQDAEECTNDLFVAVWQEIDSYDAARGSLRTWITMRAKYIALDRRRQIQRRQAVTMTSLEKGEYAGREGELHSAELQLAHGSETTMEGLVEQRERRDELRQALEALSELDRTLVYLRYFHLASTEEICVKTGLSRHAIDTRLWRARKALRDALQENTHERVRALQRE